MKKIILLGLTLMLILGLTTVVYAANAIKNGGEHNMAAQVGGDAASAEVCKYCHTPHKSAEGVITNTLVPLNNRVAGANDMTAWCMTCHDGTGGVGATAETIVDYTTPVTSNVTEAYAVLTGVGMTLGANNHPAGGAASYGTTTANGIVLYAEASAQSDLSSTALGAQDSVLLNSRVDCNSCHYVHVYQQVPTVANQQRDSFLRILNTGSRMCLACHNI
ncbi:MAG: hypothetical protein HY754_03750 [Nitrospirae bacterium]|nr:hypothetical protein [Nitrospirota bacterium]